MKNVLAFLTSYKAKKAELDKLTAEVESMKKELIDYTKEKVNADEKGKYTFTCGQYTITISACTRTDIDKKRLAVELPEIAEQYKTETQYERMTVK